MNIEALPLQYGDKIGIVSPSSAVKPGALESGINYLKGKGFQVQLSKHLYDKERFLAGKDEDRVNDINDFFKDPEIKAIIVMKYNDLLLCDGKLSNQIKPFDVLSYGSAIKFINKLLYGRNQNTGITCVLEEQKGTFSTKHAFLAALAEENGLPIKLMLGYYQMNRDNTPQIGNVLEKNFLPFIAKHRKTMESKGGVHTKGFIK